MNKALDKVIEDWHEHDTLRVWSIIITLFGDTILPRGGAVSLQTVQTILQRLDVEPGAVRTAFSRLAKDGWVQREKRGRQSFYRLAHEGVEPFVDASRLIYAAPPSLNKHVSKKHQAEPFVILIGDRETRDDAGLKALLLSLDALELRRNVFLIEHPGKAKLRQLQNGGLFTVNGQVSSLPVSLIKRLRLDELAEEYQRLITRFRPLAERPPSDGLDALAARCLLVHSWRRVLLRTPSLAGAIMPQSWPQSACHEVTARLYHKLLPASAAWLSQYATGPEGALDREKKSVLSRFR